MTFVPFKRTVYVYIHRHIDHVSVVRQKSFPFSVQTFVVAGLSRNFMN